MKECHLIWFWSHFIAHCIQLCISISQRSKCKFKKFFLWKPKVSIYSISVCSCAPSCKVSWAKAIDRQKSNIIKIWILQLSSNKFPQAWQGKETVILLWPNISLMSVNHLQFLKQNTRKLELCFGTNVQTARKTCSSFLSDMLQVKGNFSSYK